MITMAVEPANLIENILLQATQVPNQNDKRMLLTVDK